MTRPGKNERSRARNRDNQSALGRLNAAVRGQQKERISKNHGQGRKPGDTDKAGNRGDFLEKNPLLELKLIPELIPLQHFREHQPSTSSAQLLLVQQP
jgi:hypothetical protein